MPYIFSSKQIDRCHHLISEHNYDVHKVAEVMGTTIRNAHHLIRLAWQKYPKRKFAQPERKKHVFDMKPIDVFLEKDKPVFVRPKAEYSNKRIYDLI